MKVYVLGTGHSVPAAISNEDLLRFFPHLKATKEWIEDKIKIRRRHTCLQGIADNGVLDTADLKAAKGFRNSDLCERAVRAALAVAGLEPSDLDMLIVSSCTPDVPIPPMCSIVMEKLGLNKLRVMDVRSACCGSTIAIQTADAYIRSGKARTVAVVSGDVGTVYGNLDALVNPTYSKGDMVNACMIGDAAAALVLRGVSDGDGSGDAAPLGPELLFVETRCIGNGQEPGMWMESGGSQQPFSRAVLESGGHFFKHDFSKVLEHGALLYKSGIDAGLNALNLTMADFDLFIPHQANAMITDFALKMGVDAARVHEHFRDYGNTANASLPLGLDLVAKQNVLPENALVMMIAAESTKWLFGCTVFRWHAFPNASGSVAAGVARLHTVTRWQRWISRLRSSFVSLAIYALSFYPFSLLVTPSRRRR
jgi:3-oxoacyl-[acyl-carrier-protein] synthase-3